MNDPVKIAIVGTGYAAKVALPVYRQLDQFDPVACWSRTPGRAREVAEGAGLALGTSDYEELLKVPGLEAVHIATPVTTHEQMAVAAADRGLHVLCEKPVAQDLASARRIADAVRRAGVVSMVGFELSLKQTRRQLIERAREVVGRPRMVTIAQVHSDHSHPGSRPFTWVHDAALGGGRFQGYGVHDLELVLQLFPSVEAVAAATEVGVPMRVTGDGGQRRVTAEDAYGILLRFTGGGLGVISLVATARHARKDQFEIYGDSGTAKLDSQYRVWWGREGEELQCEGPLDDSFPPAFTRLAQSFHAAIRDGADPDLSIEGSLGVQAVFDAVRTADIERRWVRPAPVG